MENKNGIIICLKCKRHYDNVLDFAIVRKDYCKSCDYEYPISQGICRICEPYNEATKIAEYISTCEI